MKVITKALDDKDKRIIALCAEGKTAKQIGYEMNLSQRTVEGRILIMRKYYGCKNVTELVLKVNTLAT